MSTSQFIGGTAAISSAARSQALCGARPIRARGGASVIRPVDSSPRPHRARHTRFRAHYGAACDSFHTVHVELESFPTALQDRQRLQRQTPLRLPSADQAVRTRIHRV
jgi:hypothetical protein